VIASAEDSGRYTFPNLGKIGRHFSNAWKIFRLDGLGHCFLIPASYLRGAPGGRALPFVQFALIGDNSRALPSFRSPIRKIRACLGVARRAKPGNPRSKPLRRSIRRRRGPPPSVLLRVFCGSNLRLLRYLLFPSVFVCDYAVRDYLR
jgi:hypothetical protein